MSIMEALTYGFIQGITEFLPISSSGHLILLPWFLRWKDPGLAFNVALHWGTLSGVMAYFWRDLGGLIKGGLGLFGPNKSPETRLSLQIILATFPAAIAGVFIEPLAESSLRSPWIVAFMLFSVGLFLLMADKKTSKIETFKHLSWNHALLIGSFQALALIPGTSRSGITIAMALFLGLSRPLAVRFSFLLSVPIILGAGILKIGYILESLNNPIFWVGLLSAAGSGYGAIWFLMRFIKTRNFTPFVVYRWILAGIIVWKLI